MSDRAPLGFFLKGLAGLAALFALTLLMAPRPEVTALQGMIGFGVAVVVGKLVLRRLGVNWPPRRR